ncbi:hypothetical protein M9H77_16983 [Catharanthus roseus]|uniref:Uncharacterized protein n=1 Tax=Catharanthus roseus TaxID=4058 RepID=A0ACC0B399_CATRO|nr:hypothetical protein M9H77_16983 [Catharanthus roseus]
MRRLAKGVLNPVLPEDPSVILTSPPEVVVTKGRKKTNSIKRDKSQADLVLVLALDLDRSPVRVLGGDLMGEGDCHELLEKGVEGATMTEILCSVMNVNGQRLVDECFMNWSIRGIRMIHWPVDEPALYAHWFETPDSLYTIANAFNLCVILIAQLGSTTVLPLYSYSDHPGDTLLQLNDMCPIPPLHVQWIHHRSEWVNNNADSYHHRIVDWNARVARNRK